MLSMVLDIAGREKIVVEHGGYCWPRNLSLSIFLIATWQLIIRPRVQIIG